VHHFDLRHNMPSLTKNIPPCEAGIVTSE